MPADPILAVHGLSKVFGGLQALSQLDFEVPRHGITALIGPNGAGKTTCINLVSGVYPVSAGRVIFDGRTVTGLKSHRLARLGLARTFQNLQVFRHMTVLENVMVGLHTRASAGFVSSMLQTPRVRREERIIREKAMSVLELFGLADKAHVEAPALAYGDQKRTEMARALAGGPSLVLLDEPVAGLNNRETEQIGRLIQDLPGRGVTVLLVEHDMDLVMGISDQVMVLNYGQMIASGSPRTVQGDPRVIAAYLGDANLGTNGFYA